MTRDEIIQELIAGKKVTHDYFTDDEWLMMDGNMYLLEDGVKLSPEEFWKYRQSDSYDNGWSIFNDK
jgi:hypothetical protein